MLIFDLGVVLEYACGSIVCVYFYVVGPKWVFYQTLNRGILQPGIKLVLMVRVLVISSFNKSKTNLIQGICVNSFDLLKIVWRISDLNSNINI